MFCKSLIQLFVTDVGTYTTVQGFAARHSHEIGPFEAFITHLISTMSPGYATRSATSTASMATLAFNRDKERKGEQEQGGETTSTPKSLPKTPDRKRVKAADPATAIPSKKLRTKTIKARSMPDRSSGEIAINRPAEPHITNAPLATPGGSRYVAYPRSSQDAVPNQEQSQPTTTTEHLLEQACAHLVRVEPKMQLLVEKHHCRMFSPEGLAEECDPFKSLCSGIMAQQVSGAAAASIKRKFIALFHTPDKEEVLEASPFPTPTQVAACNIAFLRQAGLSERKAEYIKGLAEKFLSGELGAAMLINASDEEVLEKLIAVRGLGKWSVEMFACFGLKRMDIFSTGDLGVQWVHPLGLSRWLLICPRRGMAAFIGKDVKKLKAKGAGKWKYMSEQDMVSSPLKLFARSQAASRELCPIKSRRMASTCSLSRVKLITPTAHFVSTIFPVQVTLNFPHLSKSQPL